VEWLVEAGVSEKRAVFIFRAEVTSRERDHIYVNVCVRI
jgi:hypothetical protein